jgi:sugar lactone lactonase YvrE
VRKDALGNTYILDNDLSRVYKVDSTGKLTLFAGTGFSGFSGEGALAVNASMNGPSGLCIDSNNNVYVADSDNGIIREIPVTTVGPKVANHIYTVAGTQETDFTYGGDGGSATSPNAHLHFPDGCSFDSHGNLYIADRGNNAIRVVIGTSGTAPIGIPAATTPGNIYLFAGSPGAVPPNPPAGGYGANGTAANVAPLYGPFDVFVDSHDNVFYADLGNNFPPAGPNKDLTIPFNNNVIREIPATAQTFPFAMTAGDVYTVAGVQGLLGVGHTTSTTGTPVVATAAHLDQAVGIFVDASGDIFFADQVNQVIREVPAVTAGGMVAGDIYDIAGTALVRGYSHEPSAATANNLNSPAGTFVDASGNLFIADSNNDRVREVPLANGIINTFAGNGSASFSNAIPATAGQLDAVAGVAVDRQGNLAIADVGTNGDDQSLIRGVATPIVSGALTTLVGQTSFAGFSNTSPFVVNNARGVAYDSAGNLYVADTGNCIVREVIGASIATVAGIEPVTPDPTNPDATVPQCGFATQGTAAVGTMLGAVNSVAIDASGDIFFSDATNNVIWEIPKATVGSLVAGNAYIVIGTQSTTGAFGGEGGPANQAQLNTPTGISFDIPGNLFIADTGNNLVREVPAFTVTTPVAMTQGSIYTVAGAQGQPAGFTADGQPAVGSKLNAPFTAVADNVGNIYIADTNNQVIRVVAGKTGGGRTVGDLYTTAGTHGTAGFAGDGAAATSAQLNAPQGLAIDGAGDLLIGDSGNIRIRSVAAVANVAPIPLATLSPNPLTFTAEPVGVASSPALPITLSNGGGAVLTVSAIHITGTNASDYTETDNCVTPGTVAAGATCTINVTFTPHALNASVATLTVTDSAFGSPQSVALAGTGGSPAAVLSANALTFASTVIGTPTAAQMVTVTNTGNVATTISSIVVAGANIGDFSQTNTCTAPLAATTGTCTISVIFKPTAAGARAAEIDIADNVTGSPQVITLAGTGTAPVAPFAITNLEASGGAAGATQTVTAGSTATYNMQVTTTGGTSMSSAVVTIACTPQMLTLTKSTCTVPAPITVTVVPASGEFNLTVSTTAATTTGMLAPQIQTERQMQPPTAIQMLPLAALALLFSIITMLSWTKSPAARMRAVRVALSLCLILMPIAAATILVGCGGGSSSPAPVTPPTPVTVPGTAAGTYTLTVSATSGSTKLTTNLTLVVQ